MKFRVAAISDIASIQKVRNSVKENRLSNPGLITDLVVEDFITKRGKGWVCEMNSKIVGFAIVDLQESNIWALFIHPDYEKRGIGKKLQQIMLDWFFSNSDNTLWLSTSPGTRAEAFYLNSGWVNKGKYGIGEIKFEMNLKNWAKSSKKSTS